MTGNQYNKQKKKLTKVEKKLKRKRETQRKREEMIRRLIYLASMSKDTREFTVEQWEEQMGQRFPEDVRRIFLAIGGPGRV